MEYTWDPVKLVYTDEDGHEVSQQQIRDWIDETCVEIAVTFQGRADEWRSGAVDFNNFYVDTEREIESLHYACGALAYGGINNLNNQVEQISTFKLQIQPKIRHQLKIKPLKIKIKLQGRTKRFTKNTTTAVFLGALSFLNAYTPDISICTGQ